MRTLLVGLALASSLSFARDPFAKTTEPEPPVAQCTTSLCRHALAELKLVAIVARGPESVAMFENNLGKGFVARRNAQIGTSGARITQIDRDCLTLTRYSAAADGHFQPISERVCLSRPEQAEEHDYLTDGPYRVP